MSRAIRGATMTVAPRPIVYDGRCGGKKRQGSGICTQAAGWGTDHVGQGRCKLHGGCNPIRTGRYSTIQRPIIRDLIQRHASDPEPLNTLPELAAVRALFEDFVNRYTENTEALLAWHTSWTTSQRPLAEEKVLAFERIVDDFENQQREAAVELTESQEDALSRARDFLKDLRRPDDSKPRQILDLADAYHMLSEVTKIAERIENSRNANAVSRGDLLRILSEMGRTVDLWVTDEATRAKIRDGWQSFRL